MAKNKKIKQKSKSKLLISLFIVLGLLILVYNPVSVRLMTLGYAVYYKINPKIFYRLISAESSFRSFAISNQNAIGLGQVQEVTAKYINVTHKRGWLFVPFYNLTISARYLLYLQSRYNHNWSIVLAAYNWGETNVDKRITKIDISPEKDYRNLFEDIPETYDFITKILKK